jgi:outer membrane protein OmpA-like peptidoglycan-associated protein
MSTKDTYVPHPNSARWPFYAMSFFALICCIMMWRSCTYMKEAAPVASAPVAPPVQVGTVDEPVNTTSGYMKKLNTGFDLSGLTNGIEGQLVGFIESDKVVDKTTWFNFDRLNFKTGSAELDMDKSKEQLNNMNEILKAFPKVNLKVGGYTDNTGNADANMKLSQARAEAVVGALTGMGTDKARLEAQGYGSEHPVGDNTTEEGRAQNRRIAVRVTAK